MANNQDLTVQFAVLWGIEMADSRVNEERYEELSSYDSQELEQMFRNWGKEYLQSDYDDTVEFFHNKLGELMDGKKQSFEMGEDNNLYQVTLLTCTHETKYGIDTYVSIHADQELALAHVPEVKEGCEFEEDAGEYFDYEIEEQVIDISKLKPVQKIEQEKATESLTMEDSLSKAAELVDEMLSQEGGSTLLHLANIYQMLTECDLEREERLQLTNRIHEITGMSDVPVLSTERADAVRFMLENGISPNMSPEFTSISAEQAKELLLSCDIEVFSDLVDAVAVDSQEYYGPEQEFFCEEMIQRVNKAIEGIQEGGIEKAETLDEKVNAAKSEQKKENGKNMKKNEKEMGL